MGCSIFYVYWFFFFLTSTYTDSTWLNLWQIHSGVLLPLKRHHPPNHWHGCWRRHNLGSDDFLRGSRVCCRDWPLLSENDINWRDFGQNHGDFDWLEPKGVWVILTVYSRLVDTPRSSRRLRTQLLPLSTSAPNVPSAMKRFTDKLPSSCAG